MQIFVDEWSVLSQFDSLRQMTCRPLAKVGRLHSMTILPTQIGCLAGYDIRFDVAKATFIKLRFQR